MCCLSRLGTSVSVVVCCLLSLGGLAPLAGSQGTPAPQTQPQPQPIPELRPRMREHFSKGAAIRDAVIRADLEGVRAPAKWLAEHPQEDLPDVGAARTSARCSGWRPIWPGRRTCPGRARRGAAGGGVRRVPHRRRGDADAHGRYPAR